MFPALWWMPPFKISSFPFFPTDLRDPPFFAHPLFLFLSSVHPTLRQAFSSPKSPFSGTSDLLFPVQSAGAGFWGGFWTESPYMKKKEILLFWRASKGEVIFCTNHPWILEILPITSIKLPLFRLRMSQRRFHYLTRKVLHGDLRMSHELRAEHLGKKGLAIWIAYALAVAEPCMHCGLNAPKCSSGTIP